MQSGPAICWHVPYVDSLDEPTQLAEGRHAPDGVSHEAPSEASGAHVASIWHHAEVRLQALPFTHALPAPARRTQVSDVSSQTIELNRPPH